MWPPTPEECFRWSGSVSRRDGKSSTITPARWCHRTLNCKRASENLEDFFVALERRNQVRPGKFGARPGKHVAGDFETAIACGGSGALHRFQQRLGDDDAGDFVVQAQSLFVTIQRPDAD